MSPPETGGGAVRAMVDQSKALVASAAAEEEQLDLLEQPTSEEIVEAREELGPSAGRMAVLRHARAKRGRGRPKNARNRRTDDFVRYIGSFGQDPAITLMQIQSTPEEVMVEASRRKVTKVLKGGKDKPDTVVEVEEETLTFEGARSMRIRCAEALMPFFHSKKPVAIDMTLNGVGDLMIEGVTHTREEMHDILDAEFMAIGDSPAPGGEAAE
jgi:hypothetical protein